jgi:hypothetical protein
MKAWVIKLGNKYVARELYGNVYGGLFDAEIHKTKKGANKNILENCKAGLEHVVQVEIKELQGGKT